MKIENWNKLEEQGFKKTKDDRWIKNKIYYYEGICKECGEKYLSRRKDTKYCSHKCSSKGKNNPFSGKKHSEKAKEKMRKNCNNKGENNPMFGKKHTKETKRKIGNANKGNKWTEDQKKKLCKQRKGKYKNENNHSWKGGYNKKGIPIYDTYSPKIDWCEETRRSPNDPNVLEVKCFKCREWFVPKIWQVRNKYESLKNNKNYKGYFNFYCSDECRNACSVYRKTPDRLMKEDAKRLEWLKESKREVQPELRKMVLERDNHTCQKCGSKEELQCHHILPVTEEPLLSADVDNCITLCYNCHKEAHRKDGCRLPQLRFEIC